MSSEAVDEATWWDRLVEMNEQYADAAEQTMEAQSRVLSAWLDSVEASTRQDRLDDDLSAFVHAYEIWTTAAVDTVEQLSDVLEGEDVPVERFRDTWLNAANRAFKDAMRTTLFARATGGSIDDVMAVRRQADEVAEATLHEMGLPARADVEEVGERLVELERRQQAVETRLEALVEAVDAEA